MRKNQAGVRSLRMAPKAIIMCLALACGIQAQETAAPEPQLKWATLHEPVYPQMARIAHIQGEVWIEIEVDPAGTIVALRPQSGHPILIRAATESLQLSKPICQDCGADNGVFFVRFLFKIPDPPQSHGSAAANELLRLPMDPLPRRKTRSARCLYLWKCVSLALAHDPVPGEANGSQNPQTLVPAASVRPTHPSPSSPLRP
jgi:Gram-negative bacterial TonB protein C-terminal